MPLRDQDRSGWDRDLVAEGHDLVRDCLARERATGVPPGRYQLLAAINAVHTDAADARDTDWAQIAALYGLLVRDRRLAGRPAEPRGRGRRAGRAGGGAGRGRPARSLGLDGYHAWHATRADLLRRLGRSAESRAAYDAAIATAGNEAERAWLARRRDTLVTETP